MFGVRGVGQFVGPDALAVRVDNVVRNGNGFERQGPRIEASPANDGTQRAGDIQGVPREGKRVGKRTKTDQGDGRQPVKDGRAKITKAGTDAHGADVQGKFDDKTVLEMILF